MTTVNAPAYEVIDVDVPRPGVGRITLSRPKNLNALNSQVEQEVVRAASAFEEDASIGAIVITGSDRAFAAGADIAWMATLTFADLESDGIFDDWDRLATLRTPLIAAVSGYALGGGNELAMLCDIVIAADNAIFGQPEIKLAVLPGIGGTQRLTRAVGKAKAMDLCLTGRTMDASEAERAGLVSRVVPQEQLIHEALEVAELIAAMSRSAVTAAKNAVNRAFEVTLAEGIRFERQAFVSRFASADRTEGMAAFLEKRPPRFADRRQDS